MNRILASAFVAPALRPAVPLRGLGFNLRFATGADHSVLKRGVKEANIAYCAPMQLYHGLMSQIADDPADYIFLPMVRGLDHVGNEPHAKVCPIVQASPCILRQDLGAKLNGNLLSPVIDVGAGNYGLVGHLCNSLA